MQAMSMSIPCTSVAVLLLLTAVKGQDLFPMTNVRSIDEPRDVVIPLMRMMPDDLMYDMDGSSMMPGRPNPRHISNCLAQHASGENPKSRRRLSDMVWAWGQFIDHGIDHTPSGSDWGTANIDIPQDSDDVFSTMGCNAMGFTRSRFVGTPRQQVNDITALLDASMVYGSETTRANALRTHTDGLLKTTENGKMLPKNTFGLANAGGDGNRNLFFAGDVRANEQAGLLAMHTLFVREHNRLAQLIKAKHPDATDEDIYQLARKLVGATVQKITYEEFLPALMGHHAPNPNDYSLDLDTDSTVANEFSTFAYRFGHSMLSSELRLANADGTMLGTVELRNIFFRPDFLTDEIVDQLVIGFTTQTAQEVDTRVIEDIRSFLFHDHSDVNAQSSCLDLAALNIQRGRDHGIPTCKTLWKNMFGDDREELCFFSQLTSNTEVQANLRLAYPKRDPDDPCDNVAEVDAWVCGLAEQHMAGSSLGELDGKIIKDQFIRIMKADPFFYKWDPYLAEKKEALQGIWDESTVTLAKVIRDNTNSKMSPRKNVFFSGGGGAGGDPHFLSFGGEYFDFHGACDLVLVRMPHFADDLGLTVHVRTTIRQHYSYIESAAIKIGDSILEVSSYGQYVLDGISNAEMPNTLSGYDVIHTNPRKDQNLFIISLGADVQIVVKVYKDLVNVDVDISSGVDATYVFQDTVGLMGSWYNGTHYARDGQTLVEDPVEFGQEWQVLDTEDHLFMTDRNPQYPNKCTMPNLEARNSRRLGEAVVSPPAASTACAYLKELHAYNMCVYDVIATGDLSLAAERLYY